MNIELTPEKTGRGAFIENSCALYAIDTRTVGATTGALSCKYSDTIYIGKLKAVEYKIWLNSPILVTLLFLVNKIEFFL